VFFFFFFDDCFVMQEVYFNNSTCDGQKIKAIPDAVYAAQKFTKLGFTIPRPSEVTPLSSTS